MYQKIRSRVLGMLGFPYTTQNPTQNLSTVSPFHLLRKARGILKKMISARSDFLYPVQTHHYHTTVGLEFADRFQAPSRVVLIKMRIYLWP